VQAAPSTWPYIEIINNHILRGELYKALKHSRKLIEYEEDLFRNAESRGTNVQKSSQRDREHA
jgi:flagellar protein FlbT